VPTLCAAALNNLLATANPFYPIFLFLQMKETTRRTNSHCHSHVVSDPYLHGGKIMHRSVRA